MKKLIIFTILVLIFFAVFVWISIYKTDDAIIVISIDDVNGITPEEAEKLCFSVFGKEDKETGFLFLFSVTGAIEQKNKQYYIIRMSWLVNNSHLSYIGDCFVSVDGKEIYTGIANPPEEYIMDSLIWSE
ncbi:MAG: hypothetical protein E7393_04730 [Ruminococcaceae bacterium]|nr:hypothetical protein [Oscillospiraceae bacterium]